MPSPPQQIVILKTTIKRLSETSESEEQNKLWLTVHYTGADFVNDAKSITMYLLSRHF